MENRPHHRPVILPLGLFPISLCLNPVDEGYRLVTQLTDYSPRVGKTASAFHITDRIQLDFFVLGSLFENVDKLMVPWVGADTVDNRERKFALGQILTESLVLGVGRVGQVEIVIADLKGQSHDIDKAHAVFAGTALGLHQLDRQSEETARLVANHLQIVLFGRTGERVSPEQIHPLTPMQVQEFLNVNINSSGVIQLLHLLKSQKVYVIGRVDGLRGTEDVVSDGNAAAEDGVIFNIIDPGRRRESVVIVVEHFATYSNEAV